MRVLILDRRRSGDGYVARAEVEGIIPRTTTLAQLDGIIKVIEATLTGAGVGILEAVIFAMHAETIIEIGIDPNFKLEREDARMIGGVLTGSEEVRTVFAQVGLKA